MYELVWAYEEIIEVLTCHNLTFNIWNGHNHRYKFISCYLKLFGGGVSKLKALNVYTTLLLTWSSQAQISVMYLVAIVKFAMFTFESYPKRSWDTEPGLHATMCSQGHQPRCSHESRGICIINCKLGKGEYMLLGLHIILARGCIHVY